jgi:hypothetical protein
MISLTMIHSPMAGAMMERSWRGEILQQTLPTVKMRNPPADTANRKMSMTSEELKDQTC